MGHSADERLRLLDELAEPLYTGVELPAFRGIGLGERGTLRDSALAPKFVKGVWFTVLFAPVWPLGGYVVSKRRNWFADHPVHARVKLSDIRKIWGIGSLIGFILSAWFEFLCVIAVIVAIFVGLLAVGPYFYR
jgi:hypothetical protein